MSEVRRKQFGCHVPDSSAYSEPIRVICLEHLFFGAPYLFDLFNIKIGISTDIRPVYRPLISSYFDYVLPFGLGGTESHVPFQEIVESISAPI